MGNCKVSEIRSLTIAMLVWNSVFSAVVDTFMGAHPHSPTGFHTVLSKGDYLRITI